MFKIGDRVEYIGTESCELVGRKGVVMDLHPVSVMVDWEGYKVFGVYPHNIRSVTTASPIREITRKEIVPGVYGRVKIHSADNGGCGEVGLNFMRRDGTEAGLIVTGFNADELDAAASVLTQIASVLRESQ